MNFFSINDPNYKVDFKTAITKGQAPDGSLFFPEKIPKIDQKTIQKFAKQDYHEIAFEVLKPFLCPEIPVEILQKLTQSAYDFTPEIEEIKNFKANTFVARMDTGPTAAFKDFAARLMAKLFEYSLQKQATNKVINILVATSGDTGSAVASAFHGLENINISVLFPLEEISPTQRKLMTTLGKNVKCFGVEGKFDDCQRMVKTAFVDKDLQKINLSSANSINIGRLLPQIVYYFYIASRLPNFSTENQSLVFAIPSGNFGNLMGALFAYKMGLNIKKIIASTNSNNSFTKFLENRKYEPINPSINCLSNAMNVGSPNNIFRIVEFFEGRMQTNFEILNQPNFEKMQELIFAQSFSDEETKNVMKTTFEKGLILEPHGAVGFLGLQKYWQKDTSQDYISVLLETASPAKFPDEMEQILNYIPKKPNSIKSSENLPEQYQKISSNYEEFKSLLLASV